MRGGIVMAKLPPLVTEGINAIWSEDWTLKEKNFYSILGQAVRKGVALERNKEKGGDTKDQSD